MSSKFALNAIIFVGLALVVTVGVLNRRRPSSPRDRLRSLSKLKNQYWAIRHGESEANVANLVSSDDILARKQHGLTTKGCEDARRGANAILSNLEASSVIVVHSPFLRTTQTAEIVCEVLQSTKTTKVERVEEELLRERWFGMFEGKHSHDSYSRVWERDEVDGCEVNEFMCESVYSVSDRAAEAILRYEEKYPGKTIVFVSHGDTLQIMRATLDKQMDPKHHRRGEHLNPGQAIPLTLA